MTGIEGTAAIGAVASAVSKVAAEDPSDKEALRRVAGESGVLQPAAEVYAKRVAVKQHIRLKLMQPLGRMFGMSREYFDTRFEDEMAERMAAVPEEDVVTPPTSVAGPSIMGIGFTVEEPDLREMYLNLLATASNRQQQHSAHPAFAEIIRQISAEEARLLPSVLRGRTSKSIIQVQFTYSEADKGYEALATNVLHVEVDGVPALMPRLSTYVDNWQRLGLIEVAYDRRIVGDQHYEWADTSPAISAARAAYEGNDEGEFTNAKGILMVTDFGQLFASAVLPTNTLVAVG